MQKLMLFLIAGMLLGCSPKIKSIVEYRKKGDRFIKNRITHFDRKGNKVRQEGGGNPRSNYITTAEFKNNRKVFEKNCEYFKSLDSCVVRSFSKFEFDAETGIKKQTLFEPDSSIRFIKETRKLKRIAINIVHTWEFDPVKKPEIEKAMVLTDTTYFDRKGRKIKRVHYNADFKEPWIEIFKYHKDGYSWQTIGTAGDTIREFRINVNKLQKMADKKKIDYKFRDPENYTYEIERY